MEIDLSTFRNVSVDAEKNTLTVGGGVRFLNVFDPVFNAGKEISTFRHFRSPSVRCATTANTSGKKRPHAMIRPTKILLYVVARVLVPFHPLYP
jgi:hypothetical protein